MRHDPTDIKLGLQHIANTASDTTDNNSTWRARRYREAARDARGELFDGAGQRGAGAIGQETTGLANAVADHERVGLVTGELLGHLGGEPRFHINGGVIEQLLRRLRLRIKLVNGNTPLAKLGRVRFGTRFRLAAIGSPDPRRWRGRTRQMGSL